MLQSMGEFGRSLYQSVTADVVARGIVDRRNRNTQDLWQGSTAEFVEQVLHAPLWEGQEAICDALDEHRFVAVRSCHASGKSFNTARAVLAFLHRHPHSIVVTTAPTNRQVKNILWRNINSAARRNPDALLGRPLQMSYEIEPDWYALGFKGSSDNVDAMQGFHAEHILVVIDEAAGVPDAIFEAADAILTGEGASCLLIGNPTSSRGRFRDAFHGDRDDWHTIKISAYDTPNFTTFGITRQDMIDGTWQQKIGGSDLPYPALISPSWVDRQIRTHGPDSPFITSRVDAEFPEEGADTLIPLALIEAANERVGELDNEAVGPFHVGLDIARYGGDETSLTLRRGPVYYGQWSWSKVDGMETVGRVVHILNARGIGREEAVILPDVVGVGGPVADRLRELGWRVQDVNVGAASSNREQWQNLRHELWWQLRDRFVEGRIAPRRGCQFDELMMAQASDVHYKYQSGYTMPLIESKEQAARRGVKSPDRAESVMLAYATLPEPDRPLGVVRVGKQKGRW